ncbi:hypothetical protein CAOG_06455 [Capsaspora owczarzaki ATCC 30864]|uniref:hypothetical protein n=1 Tax=Capsaspora owczarzaki (strain ATCC 30864) TaxID=595528 RepID=UPI0001FE2FCA|nr:hypothetical protein CAOG_06455 [Capsaspora owczarzaki ATCC 30864]|eukprot:XP_004345204.1 hypothetical protein CAOG_06455 [Capsaspora owczarzaki ATCC 30864]
MPLCCENDAQNFGIVHGSWAKQDQETLQLLLEDVLLRNMEASPELSSAFGHDLLGSTAGQLFLYNCLSSSMCCTRRSDDTSSPDPPHHARSELKSSGTDMSDSPQTKCTGAPLQSDGHTCNLDPSCTEHEYVNARDCDGLTPLHGAAASGSWETVLLLLLHGADPDAQTVPGNYT